MAKKSTIKKAVQDKSNNPDIVIEGHPALRELSKEVPVDHIKSKEIQKLIEKMKVVLASQEDGIGLAAPQVGVPLRIFIVSKKVFGQGANDMVFINPVITKFSREKKWMEGEGCLSVRWIYGKVKRSTKVNIMAYDEKGLLIERGAGGLLAHIFQHEVDHLNGILFIDKAKDLERIEPKDVKPKVTDNVEAKDATGDAIKNK